MSWRTVVISSRSKLDFKMGFMVVRSEDSEKRIHLDDISVVICETTAVSLTAYLLAELTNRKIKIIFCDHLHNPAAELVPLRGSYDSSGKIREQIKWSAEIKANIWQVITRQKIKNQAAVLTKAEQLEKSRQLLGYAAEVQPGDATNREGHAAKVYFNALFGLDFYRDSDDVRNAALNYGYAILLSCFNREITACGYLTQLGIWHDNTNNPFNLGSDLMETFRPIIDEFVYKQEYVNFGKEEKLQIIKLLDSKVRINDAEHFLKNAIGIYVRSVFNAISDRDTNLIQDWHEL